MPQISLTDSAKTQLKNLLVKQGRDDLALRVYVSPGGCSGFSYGMSLEDETGEDDYIYGYEDNLKVVVDPFSAQYLDGAQVDFVDALMGGGFTVQNPQAVTSCSCGSSFRTAAESGVAKPCG